MTFNTAPIPSHITGLYIFTVLNLFVMFNISLVHADVNIMDNKTDSRVATYEDQPAEFGPSIKKGISAFYELARPNKDGCGKLEKSSKAKSKTYFVIIERSLREKRTCDFDEKVYNAQKAGYSGVIVANLDSNSLITMTGRNYSKEIKIPSVFIGLDSYRDIATNYLNVSRYHMYIDEKSNFNILLYLWPFAIVISCAFFGLCLFLVIRKIRGCRRNTTERRLRARIDKLPIKKFIRGDKYETCTICLDDFNEGDKVRILPCEHAFHLKCIDPWLKTRRRECPICKKRVLKNDPSEEEDYGNDSDDSDEEIDIVPNNGGGSENDPLLANSNIQYGSTSGVGIWERLRDRFRNTSSENHNREHDPADEEENTSVAIPHSYPQDQARVHQAYQSRPNYSVLGADENEGAVGGLQEHNDQITESLVPPQRRRQRRRRRRRQNHAQTEAYDNPNRIDII